MAHSSRKRPAHGLLVPSDQVPIVFLTVCTKNRQMWLDSESVHQLLRVTWQNADAWLVGRYVIMPDHLHVFVAPGRIELTLGNWVRYWKSQFTKVHQTGSHRWQSDYWDTRIRTWQGYDEKWDYVRFNPVRHGLVAEENDWPYQGELNELRWD